VSDRGMEDQELVGGDASVELSSNRTSLSFERTRMAADSTLMSIVRTSLSLISFGFTIYQVFAKATTLVANASVMGRRMGVAMLALGILLLIMGILSHGNFDRELSARRDRLHGLKLLRRQAQYKATPTYVTAVALLFIGLVLLATVLFRLM
jgi:putative membrane protein